ncbi:hypothetical protein JDV02_007436 [Purpureocillium takamizusanense]|uniref:Uncharacterized protein n=1 Tax=Purpureocillium takamizusanense TaxID=2060973 RepID=A0A9Q8QKN5_9HYPO|nr:uncharacterized protein JDV02_007436 [Purpureocillium takamizusanense]UNI21445.1 hypothetical protein JDV02_007436 [Purpureocillium takamizusanense]
MDTPGAEKAFMFDRHPCGATPPHLWAQQPVRPGSRRPNTTQHRRRDAGWLGWLAQRVVGLQAASFRTAGQHTSVPHSSSVGDVDGPVSQSQLSKGHPHEVPIHPSLENKPF